MSDVVAVVPTLGSDESRLRRCLDSLAAGDDRPATVVVVWNDPRRPVPPLGAVDVLEPGCNLGFAGSIAHARRRTSGRYLWLVQDDMWVEPRCLRALRDRLEADASIAIAAPATVDEDGFVPALSRGGVVAPDRTMDHWFPIERVRPSDLDTSHRLDWVASSGALVRVAAFDEVGGVDPSFFPVLWGDVDLGHRLTGAGHRVVVVPDAIARHRRHGSTPSFLRDVVAPVNAERFRTKDPGATTAPSIDVDRDIVDTVLPVATNGFVDVAGAGQRADDEWRRVVDHLRADLDALHDMIDHLRAEVDRVRDERDRALAEIVDLRASRSMRITAPLRAATQATRWVRDRIRR